MGLWGAAQAIGFALGGVLGTAASDLARWLIGSQVAAYVTVFTLEAALFVVAAVLAVSIRMPLATPRALTAHRSHPGAAESPTPPPHTPVTAPPGGRT